ncbi:MAG: DUF493 domain-containing protein [Myxococcota bacterium]
MDPQPDDRQRVLSLLESQHEFPGPYRFRIVVRPESRSTVITAVGAAAGEASVLEVSERPSRNGSYVALHVLTQMESAESVLDVYDVIRGLPEVIAAM